MFSAAEHVITVFNLKQKRGQFAHARQFRLVLVGFAVVVPSVGAFMTADTRGRCHRLYLLAYGNQYDFWSILKLPILRLVTYIFHLIRLEMFMLNHIFVYLDKHKLLVDEIVIRIRLSFHDGKFPDDFETISTKPGIVSLSSGRKIKKPNKGNQNKTTYRNKNQNSNNTKDKARKRCINSPRVLNCMGLKDGAIFRRACSVHLGVKDSCLRRTSSVLLFSLPNMKNVDRHFYL